MTIKNKKINYKKICLNIFFLAYPQFEGSQITEQDVINCFWKLKADNLQKLQDVFKELFSRNFFDVLELLPKELLTKIDEILLFNSLSFIGKIKNYKLYFKIKNYKKDGTKKTI